MLAKQQAEVLMSGQKRNKSEVGGWTLHQAFRLAFATPPNGNNKRKGGFKGLRSAYSAEIHKDQILRYFGDDFSLASLRMATPGELLKLHARGLQHGDPKTFDHFMAQLRERGMSADNARVPGRPNSDSTINRVMSTFRKTLTLATDKGVLVDMPKMPGKLREKNFKLRFYSDEEECEILRRCKAGGWDELADLFIVLIDTGMRFSEAVSVERRDLDFRIGLVTLRGINGEGTKNGKVRAVPMTSRVMVAFRRRIAAYNTGHEIPPCKRGPKRFRARRDLFNGLNYEAVRWRFDHIRKGMGLADDPFFTLHTARHTCASRLVQRGADLMRVMRWMGHSSMEVTLRYAHLRPDDLLSIVHVLEPLTPATDD